MTTTDLHPSAAGSPRSDFAELFASIRQAGLLDRRRGYYILMAALLGALFAAGAATFVLLGDSWWQLGTAALFAVVFTQIGFFGHDAGHRQILRTRRGNDVVGYLKANLLIGLSFGWWMGKHNAHHANPNNTERDPDVQVGALAFTPEQARPRRGLFRVLARYQAFLFFPMLLLEALNLHVASVRAIGRGEVSKPVTEGGLLVLHAAWYLGAVFAVLPPLKAVVFIAVHQGLFGLYLGCSFAPNHKGMPMLRPGEKWGHLRRQVLTSRNVRGGVVTDWMLGGLNYQIEHHLFPRMPRPNLRRVAPMVREFCRARGIAYTETGLLTSYAQTLRHLHAAGRPQPAVG
ncbi:MAG: acyl-CoA desaturase [Pseudonocardiaceae bacterium]|nr:acyl-CoA desaturase [Pseudonocardiaceae bacterium]